MRTLDLSRAVSVDRVCIRRLSGADLILVGAHMAVLSSLPENERDERANACALASMVAIAGLVTGLGAAAAALETADLARIVDLAMQELMQAARAADARGLV